jgi:hypothetical protein
LARWNWNWSRVTEDEYRANVTGMNTFFGAVIGFVLADVTTPTLMDFAVLLVLTAAIVIGILYVSASPYRWWYVLLNLLLIWRLPTIVDDASGDFGRLQVTLAVWTVMTTFVEALLAWQQRRDARANSATP